MEEIWKPIKGYEGLYEVSNLGRVKSLKRWHHPRENILKNKFTTDGYYETALLKTVNINILELIELLLKLLYQTKRIKKK